MKKTCALLLSVALLVAAFLPAGVFAAGDNGLENAIVAAKAKISIPENLTEFNYNVNNEGNRKLWFLNWNPKGGGDGGISISVDDRGTILSYSLSISYDYKNPRRFPKVSSQTAKQSAEEFIKKVNPAVAGNLKYIESSQSYPIGSDYCFNYIRLVNGIPFPDNSVNVTVNNQTGQVQYYNCNWTDDLVFPDASKAITLAGAQKAYRDKLGLKLVYNRDYTDQENPRIYSEYTARYDQSYFIDALTGERIQIQNVFYGGMGGGGFNEMRETAKADAPQQALTPEEMKAISEISKLISQDEAEKIARNFGALELTSDFKLDRAGLSRDWQSKTSYTWDLSFSKEASSDPDRESLYASIAIDAATGEIKSFYRNVPYAANSAPIYDEAASKVAVEEFLKAFKPDKFADLIYDENSRPPYLKYYGKQPQTNYTFAYQRKANGIPFIANTITIDFDAVKGKITSFYMNWDKDLSFPAIDKIIPLDDIYAKMFSDIGLELQYKADYLPDKFGIPIVRPNTKPDVKLVYAAVSGKPLNLDANTGAILDYNGQPYKDNRAPVYTDISNCPAKEQIELLAEYGIYFEGKEFKPDEYITQLDFFRLLSKTLNYYSPYMPISGGKEIDDLYNLLAKEGIVKDGEKAPDAKLSRIDGVKFIIRALKYDKVASIKGIYNCNFKDAGKIEPDLVGYVAIADGLKIIRGYDNGNFAPDRNLTRAEAAVVLCNYLRQ